MIRNGRRVTLSTLAWPTRTKTVVLVVEDELLILMDATQSLQEAEYAAIDAYDAKHALMIPQQRPDIDAIFTDVTCQGGLTTCSSPAW